MSWIMETRTCKSPGCDKQFKPGDPRQELCAMHQMLMFANISVAIKNGASLPAAVYGEMVKAGLSPNGREGQ